MTFVDKDMGWTCVLSRQCLQMESIKVEFSEKYNRKTCPMLDCKISKMWEKILAKNPRLYNASKFRFYDAILNQNGELEIKVGMTDYKDTVCTHIEATPEDINNIRKYGVDQYGDQCACFSDPIGVTAAVISNDNHIVVIKRADWVAESKGKLDTVGGHSEPGEMLKKLNMKESKVFDVDSTHVLYEIFHSIIREVRDEVNVPESSLSWPLLLGIIRNEETALKPCFIFLISCNLSKDEIANLYSQGGPETDESTELNFISKKNIESYSKNDFSNMGKNWSPCGLATLFYYHQHLINAQK